MVAAAVELVFIFITVNFIHVYIFYLSASVLTKKIIFRIFFTLVPNAMNDTPGPDCDYLITIKLYIKLSVLTF